MMRIEAPCTMNGDDAGEPARSIRRPGQIPSDCAVTLRRRNVHIFRSNPRVVRRDMLTESVVRVQRARYGQSGHTAERKLCNAFQKFAAADIAVDKTFN